MHLKVPLAPSETDVIEHIVRTANEMNVEVFMASTPLITNESLPYPCLVDAVILDELGYLPFPASSGALLFHLISCDILETGNDSYRFKQRKNRFQRTEKVESIGC